MKKLLNLLTSMRRSRLGNYIVPGIYSSLLGSGEGVEGLGRFRLFEASRHQQKDVTPHSHRFDFCCLVLSGAVHNTTWNQSKTNSGDAYREVFLDYAGAPGRYVRRYADIDCWTSATGTYEAGEWYSMRHDEIHSIVFEKGTSVLFIEGPEVTATTKALIPWVDGKEVDTLATEDWMFQEVPL